ncbi:MAG: Rrf2 family transcriptional regulator [Elusimicrobiales bacterium]|nr:Rrf2 family transcriptional regulator [Elusimicrobiales bacterium]
MKIIKKEVDYAVKALIFIYENGGKSSITKIHSQLNAPYAFLKKILQILAKNNILKSIKGIGGGFEFKKPFKEITLADITYVFSEKIKKGTCPFKNPICSNSNKCKLKFKISEIEENIYKQLSSIKLIDLWR